MNAILFYKTSATSIDLEKGKKCLPPSPCHVFYYIQSVYGVIAVAKSNFPIRYQTDENGRAKAEE